ncbi:hypothetical protein R1sor_023692 [Riccia sorocarpa]|uniref:Carbonic anhydrase n=1 Tax=Riccia sorocarpa TaxID=122646 RepID=A0ABD3GPW1_9MARC
MSLHDVEAKINAVVQKKPELSGQVAAKLEEILHDLENLSVEEGEKTGLDKLKHGFEKFKKDVYHKKTELTSKLRTGQWPKYMIVACADSRVSPDAIFQLSPGDAFIVRNVANMVPTYDAEKQGAPSIGSAVEYAVLHLKVDHIVVVGHRACGGIGALIKMTPDDGEYKTTFIENWCQIGKPARATLREKHGKDADADSLCKYCEKESVNNSLKNLLSYPFVVDAVKEGKISLHGGYYDHVEGSFEKHLWQCLEQMT